MKWLNLDLIGLKECKIYVYLFHIGGIGTGFLPYKTPCYYVTVL